MLLCIYPFSSDAPSHLAVCYYKVRVQHGLETRDPASGVSGIGVSQPRPKLGKSRRMAEPASSTVRLLLDECERKTPLLKKAETTGMHPLYRFCSLWIRLQESRNGIPR